MCDFCDYCGNKQLTLMVVNSFDGEDVNEPEFEICWDCWQKEKEKLEAKVKKPISVHQSTLGIANRQEIEKQ